MRKNLLLLLFCVLSSLPGLARDFEYTYEGQTITYTVIDENLRTCQTADGLWEAGNHVEGDLILPANPKDGDIEYTLIGFGEFSFYCNEKLASVNIPNSVTSIANHTFHGCSGLTSVTIPNSVTSIEDDVFTGCGSLTSVSIPNSVRSIGVSAFFCSGLTSIEIPNSVTSIGTNAFAGCGYLRSVDIGGLETSIEHDAFNDSNNIVLFVLHSTKVTLNGRLFALAPRYVFAPKGLDCSALQLDDHLRCVFRTFDHETTVFLEDKTILADNGRTLIFAPIYDGSSYIIPDGVTKITSDAFAPMKSAYDYDENFMSFDTLKVPSSIEEIGSNAFLNTHIEKVDFADWTKWYANVKLGNLYSNPYWNSTPYVDGVQMVTPELPDGITAIPDYINYGLQFKNEIELPRSIKRIGAYAFYNNKELYSVILPRNLEEIGESAFEGCELLENPSFPAGLKKIEDGAYKGCSSITEIELPEGLTMLGNPTDTEIENTDEDTVKGIFQGCTSLERAVVAVNIDYLADNLFKDCQSLDKIYFPLELRTIGNGAFENCKTLDEITFPATLEYIGDNAFCSGSISKLVLPDAVKHIGINSFADQKIANLSIGKGLEVISEGAFRNNQLKVVNLSEGLKEVGAFAFSSDFDWYWGGHNIGSVILPSTLTAIGDYAFSGNYISSLVIPDEVENLGPGSCGKPSILTLGSYVKNIDANAFSFEKLYTLRVKAHMPPTVSDAFPITQEQNDQLTLIVNKGRFSTYDTNARWKQFERKIEEGYTEVEIYLDGTYTLAEEIRVQSGYMPSMVTKMMVEGPLSENDLKVIKENMTSLTSLDLSNVTNLTELPEDEFAGSLLTEIFLPDNLETIGNGAFRDCRLLKLAELPASVKKIGEYAFSGCPEVNITSLPESLEQIGREAFSNSGMREVVAQELLSEIGDGAFKDCVLLECADLSMTAINNIPNDAFAGCGELDEVILPESVKNIGSSAFSNTALRNIDFVPDVDEIGGYAFSSNRRLVSATLPETITRVGSNLFENCPRLLSVTMPMGTEEVGSRVIGNDRKLANISCAAPEAPAAVTGAFDDVRHRYITVAIPKLSFRSYLSATQWGRFDYLKNCLDIKTGRKIKVTNAAEAEYQDMIKEDALEAAQDAAAQQNGGMTPARAMRRAAARVKTVENFASLFDGAQLTSWDGTTNRIFITPEPGVNVISILLNGEELIESFDGQSILLPEGIYGELEIITDAKPVLADNIQLSATELNLTTGDAATLTATVGPADAEDKTVTWTSSDEDIASVDENGEVTVVGVGNVTITASCGEVSSECALKCYPMLGDANWNGSVTITDAVDITNYVVRKKDIPEDWDEEVWKEFYTAGANANESEDGKITFADSSAAVTLALAEGTEAYGQNRVASPCSKTEETSDALVIATVSETEDGRLSVAVKLDDSREYVALQADIHHPAGIEVEVKAGERATKHSLQTRRYNDEHFRLALFNLSNKAFAANEEPLLEFVTNGTVADIEEFILTNILASDARANEFKLEYRIEVSTSVEEISNGGVSIEKTADGIRISNASGKRIAVYTLDGQTVKSMTAASNLETINLPTGIYIVKAGERTLKVTL